MLNYIYKTNEYKKLEYKNRLKINESLNELLRARIKKLKKGNKLSINVIDDIFEKVIKEAKNSFDTLIDMAEKERLKADSQVTQSNILKEEIEEDYGMSM